MVGCFPFHLRNDVFVYHLYICSGYELFGRYELFRHIVRHTFDGAGCCKMVSSFLPAAQFD